MRTYTTFNEKEINIILNDVDSTYAMQRLISEHTLQLNQNAQVRIILPTRAIKQQRFLSYKLIEGKVCLGDENSQYKGYIERECYVAYGHWPLYMPKQPKRFC